jgi:hypothetical protein
MAFLPGMARNPRADRRPHVVGPAIELADRIAELIERELHDVDRETLRCGLLTAAWRMKEAAS